MLASNIGLQILLSCYFLILIY